MQDSLFSFIEQYIRLTKEEKEAIASLGVFHLMKRGDIFLREGQSHNNSYFVLKGMIRAYYLIDGEERTTAFYTELEGMTPTGKQNADCVEDSVLLISNPGIEREMMTRFPKFETLCRVLSEELLAKQRVDFDAFKLSSPEARYLRLLRERPDLIQRVPQYQLASFLGMKPQSLSRIKARIAKNGSG